MVVVVDEDARRRRPVLLAAAAAAVSLSYRPLAGLLIGVISSGFFTFFQCAATFPNERDNGRSGRQGTSGRA